MKIYHVISIILSVLLTSFCFTAAAQTQGRFVKTPANQEGPFYPQSLQRDEDNDLVHVAGRSRPAQGNILNLSGVVLNTKGEPQKNLVIEIWQTDPQGRYNHPGSSTPEQLDPDFQYCGKTRIGADGSFFFKTLVPGAYHPRPAHIHYKIWQHDRVLLTSQIYIRTVPDTMKPFSANPSTIDLQTMELNQVAPGVFEGFFQIVL
jgi:protocatechuate 3,4-dioxygenase beta subunit